MFHNKLNEDGNVVRKKSRFVCKGYVEQEGINFGETFTPIARMKSIRIFLAYASYKCFTIYQMDVEKKILNDYLEEEVYMQQPEGFVVFDKLDYVYHLKKALYGLKKATRAWYPKLEKHITGNGFTYGSADNTLYTKIINDEIIAMKIYVDDIIFGSMNDDL